MCDHIRSITAAAQVGELTASRYFIEDGAAALVLLHTGNRVWKCLQAWWAEVLPVAGEREYDLPPIHVVVERTIEAATIDVAHSVR